jgi:hypothetical protein
MKKVRWHLKPLFAIGEYKYRGENWHSQKKRIRKFESVFYPTNKQKQHTMKLLSLIPLLALAAASPLIKDSHKTTIEVLQAAGKLSDFGQVLFYFHQLPSVWH